MSSDLIALAEKLLGDGNPTAAQYALDEEPAADRTTPPYWLAAAKVSLAAGQPDRADFQVERAQGMGAEYALVAPIKAAALQRLGRPAEAIEWWRRLLGMQPWNGVVRDELALALLEAGRTAEALTLTREAAATGAAPAVARHAAALVDAMQEIPSLQSATGYTIATQAEVVAMEELAREAHALPLPPETRARIGLDPVLAHLAQARRDLFDAPPRYRDGGAGQVLGFGQRAVLAEDDDTMSRVAWAAVDSAREVLARHRWTLAAPWRVFGDEDESAIVAPWVAPSGNRYVVRSVISRTAAVPDGRCEFTFQGPVVAAAVPDERGVMEQVWAATLARAGQSGVRLVVDCRGELHA